MLELPFSGGTAGVLWTPSHLGQLLGACSGRLLFAAGRSAHAAILVRKDWCAQLFLQNHLVNMYSKWGEMECARKLFDGMLVRNVVTWTTLISGYAQCGRGERAVEVFAGMVGEDPDVCPNEYTYASVISGCGEQGLLQQGMQVVVFFFDHSWFKGLIFEAYE